MKRKNILTITLVLLTFVFTFLPVGTAQYTVDASEAYQNVDSSSGVVTAADVNLRTGPATTFDIICKLKKDQKVTVMGKLGDWYAVYVGSSGNVGSIASQYIKLDKPKSTSANNAGTKTAAKPAATKPAVTKPAAAKPAVVKPPAAPEELVKDISDDEKTLLELVNKERKEKGLNALVLDAELMKVARLKAADMKENNYFSHTSKYYGTPFDMMKKYEIKFSMAGENLAGNKSSEKVVKAWLEDDSNNIYNEKFTHTGIGIVDNTTYGKLFVQLFMKK